MRKTILSLLIVVMFASMLSGCIGRKKSGFEDTITWYMSKPVSDMSHQSAVEEEANKIIREKIGVKLKFDFIDSASWKSKINVMISSGSEFDLALSNGIEFLNFRSQNAFMDIKDLLDKYGKNILNKVDKFAWNAVEMDGGIYGIPSQTFYVPYNSFAFKKDIVDKYNIDYKNIKTLDDLEPVLKLIKENEPGMYPILATSQNAIPSPKSTNYLETTVLGVIYDKKNDKFVSLMDSKDDIDKYKKTYEFYNKGYISKDAASKNEPNSEIKSGNYAIFSGRTDATKTSNLYGFPCVESEVTYGVISTKNILNSVTVISRTCKNPEKAIQMLDLIWSDPELSNLLAYGTENVDYTVAKEGDYTEKSIVTQSGIDVKWSIWHNWIGPLWDQWDSPWNSRESLMEKKRLNEEAEISPILGFVIDISSVKNEIAQISSIINEANPIFYTGSMPDFDNYVSNISKKLEQSGMQKIIDEAERQYKEWKIKR